MNVLFQLRGTFKTHQGWSRLKYSLKNARNRPRIRVGILNFLKNTKNTGFLSIRKCCFFKTRLYDQQSIVEQEPKVAVRIGREPHAPLVRVRVSSWLLGGVWNKPCVFIFETAKKTSKMNGVHKRAGKIPEPSAEQNQTRYKYTWVKWRWC